ncbi:MAG TPA: hypothetical protein VJ698_16235 [Noviherbaspirillum sp.]|uniref:hypothetical protein n=1 Tax=Noviherbaspirillum sp. TaxID=1926288 RepID=UPI002B49A1D0|nr:hypothetical protein [Noviherbaspirillum sp.]HJV87016.1 hypothetical protein [Noviherbaspirillum sp.]
MEGTALVCGESLQERDNRNGARMGLIAVPTMRFVHAARIERAAMDRVGRSARQRTAWWSQINHKIQQNRQTGFSTTSTSKHPSREVLAGFILEFQAILSSTDARNPIATTVQP